jgi:hypothetical protein
MRIEFDTQHLSPTDIAVLRALVGDAPASAPAPAAESAAPAAQDKPPAATPPAKKAAAKKAPAKKAAAPPPQDDEETEDLRATAVARATELLGEDQRQRVLDALAEVGAEKVSTMDADRLPDFLALLSD